MTNPNPNPNTTDEAEHTADEHAEAAGGEDELTTKLEVRVDYEDFKEDIEEAIERRVAEFRREVDALATEYAPADEPPEEHIERIHLDPFSPAAWLVAEAVASTLEMADDVALDRDDEWHIAECKAIHIEPGLPSYIDVYLGDLSQVDDADGPVGAGPRTY